LFAEEGKAAFCHSSPKKARLRFVIPTEVMRSIA